MSLDNITNFTACSGILLNLLASAFSFGVGAAFETRPRSMIQWSNPGPSDWTGLAIGYFLVAVAIAAASAMIRHTRRYSSPLMSAGALSLLAYAGFQTSRIVAVRVQRWPDSWDVSPLFRYVMPVLPTASILALLILLVILFVTRIQQREVRSDLS